MRVHQDTSAVDGVSLKGNCSCKMLLCAARLGLRQRAALSRICDRSGRTGSSNRNGCPIAGSMLTMDGERWLGLTVSDFILSFTIDSWCGMASSYESDFKSYVYKM